MKSLPITIPILLILSRFVSGYSLADTIIGPTFYTFFIWQDIPDPTNGRVNYVDQATSRSANLTYATSDTFILRADHKTVLDPSGPGRNSVRIRSAKTYTQHVAVFDIRHMPQGCGTWPAIWETKESTWPNGGEIDILEGANDQSPNTATLHTSSGCTMPGPASQIHEGESLSLDCDASTNGCSVSFPTLNSYGPSFNDIGGGWYAVERTSTYYKVWFWARNATNVPADVKNGAPTANPRKWGTPMAYFPDTTCTFDKHFKKHNIIINLTLCGELAGVTYEGSGCPSTCIDHVDNNPSAFKNAYFNLASIRVYQKLIKSYKRP